MKWRDTHAFYYFQDWQALDYAWRPNFRTILPFSRLRLHISLLNFTLSSSLSTRHRLRTLPFPFVEDIPACEKSLLYDQQNNSQLLPRSLPQGWPKPR